MIFFASASRAISNSSDGLLQSGKQKPAAFSYWIASFMKSDLWVVSAFSRHAHDRTVKSKDKCG